MVTWCSHASDCNGSYDENISILDKQEKSKNQQSWLTATQYTATKTEDCVTYRDTGNTG